METSPNHGELCEEILPWDHPNVNDTVTLHALCTNCRRFYEQSHYLTEPLEWCCSMMRIGWSTVPDYAPDHIFEDSTVFSQYVFEDAFEHALSAKDLESSAAGGCHLCAVLKDIAVKSSFPSQFHNGLDGRLKLTVGANVSSFVHFTGYLLLSVGTEVVDHSYLGLLHVDFGQKCEEWELPPKRPPEPRLRMTQRSVIWRLPLLKHIKISGKIKEGHPGRRSLTSLSSASNATFALANYWIKECMKNHPECRADDTSKLTPARVLDLGFSAGSLYLRLRAFDSLTGPIQYAALSYCWRGQQTLKLTSETLPKLEAGVEITELPRTLRDAAYICYKLGIRYLWIDSLCIPQDDSDSWQLECGSMGSIYQNCIFSIAALHAENSDGGCFSQRNVLANHRLRFSVGLSVFKDPQTDFTGLEESFGGPLGQRGWVFQEMCLAPRTLCYGDEGIYWECRRQRANEMWPDGDSGKTNISESDTKYETKISRGRMASENRISGRDMKRTLAEMGLLSSSTGIPHTESKLESFFTDWYKLIKIYTNCNLTFASDKLDAIAGIIELIQSRLGLTSLAGLWVQHLPKHLLWRSSFAHSLPTEYRAPSFTWASVDAEVVNCYYPSSSRWRWAGEGSRPLQFESCLATILQAQAATIDTTRSTGQVSGGEMRIRGPVLRLCLLHDQKTGKLNNNTCPLRSYSGERSYSDYWIYPDHQEVVYTKYPELTFMVIMRWSSHMLGEGKSPIQPGEERFVSGLVFAPVEENPALYKRVAYFENVWTENHSAWWEDGEYETLIVV